MWTFLLTRLPILTALNPYIIWIKLGLAAALLLCSFLAGVRVANDEASASLLKQERMTREWQEAATKHAQEALDAQIGKQTAMDRQRIALEKAAEQQRAAALRSAYEFWNTHPQDNVVVSAGVVRLWRNANGESDIAGPPASAASTGTPDANAGRCPVADLYTNHSDLAARYQALSRDMLELQAWSRDAVALCNATIPRQ